MAKRKLGNSDLEVSPVGYGCMGLSHASGIATEKNEAVSIIRQAFEMGYTFFDTAEVYTGVYANGTIANNEEVVGEALRPIRDQVVIATKMGVVHHGDHLEFDSRPETIFKSAEDSLKRLGIETIDLYYQHRIDPDVTPEEVAGAMCKLIQQGKIRYWGISETDEDYLRRAHAVCPVTAIQNRYSMMARWYESLFPVVEELNIAYVAFSPLANGFLSAKYTPNMKFEEGLDFRSRMPQYTEEGFEKARALLELLHNMAAEKNATPAQISLAWMLCKKPWIVPIPGSRKPERIQENLNAADVILTAVELASIDEKLNGMDLPVYGGISRR